jgi:predicted  nucleic acid-binding Zn-ribbon protein
MAVSNVFWDSITGRATNRIVIVTIVLAMRSMEKRTLPSGEANKQMNLSEASKRIERLEEEIETLKTKFVQLEAVLTKERTAILDLLNRYGSARHPTDRDIRRARE